MGTGHLDANKFANQVGTALTMPLQMIAHSGATIGRGDIQTGACGPEAQNHYPTIPDVGHRDNVRSRIAMQRHRYASGASTE